MMPRITHLVVGPRHHGVVRFGLELQANLRRNGFGASLCRRTSADAVCQFIVETAGGCIHVQFTDRLFGATAQAAADELVAVATAARTRGVRFTATLHDLPQPSDGSHFRRRALAYGRVAEVCDAVVVSSEHERALLNDCGIEPAGVAVIPLPIDRYGAGPATPRSARTRSLGVFGFVYPGKGHEEVITAAAALPRDVEVVAIGTPSAGHDDLVADLRAMAARQGRRFRITGHVKDSDLPDVLRQVTVPISAHRHISASGSLNTWLAAGRRPLAPANRYTEEIERRNPGSVALHADTVSGLEEAVTTAVDDPEITWLRPDVVLTPSPAESAAAYAEFLRRCVA